MADTTMVNVSIHSGAISKDANAAYWLDGCGDGAAARASHLLTSIDANLHKLADLLGYELTKKTTDKDT